MTLSNTSLAATSGVILVGAYLVDPSSIPFVAAGVAATWARVFLKRNAPRDGG
ncbi:NADH-cytochrome b5 reductase [Podila verticillata]|nr:NADH-cytochrome b5 reductase [Podila verticillata]